MSAKDDLLTRIIAIEGDMVEWKKEHDSVIEETEMIKPLEEVVRKEYDKIKEQLRDLEQQLSNLQYSANTARRKATQGRDDLATLRRELARLLDAEAIENAYIEKLEYFKDKCLDAPWRAENRTDGRGALHHQVEGAIRMAVAGQGILADEAGLGKSLTSLIWCDLIEAKKVIAIVPSGTVGNFVREVMLWTPHRQVLALTGEDKGTRDFALAMLKKVEQYIVVLSYSSWRRDKQLLKDLAGLQADTVILDEAHHAKSTDTAACKGVFNIRYPDNTCPGCGPDKGKIGREKNSLWAYCAVCGYGSKNKAEFSTIKNVLPMTGTPILNKPQELYPMLHLVDSLGFPKASAFLYDFCRQMANRRWTWTYGGEKALTKKIGARFLQRTRKDAGIVIPPNTVIRHVIPFEDVPKLQCEAYQQVRDYAQLILNPDKNVAISMPKFITVLLRLRQVITAPSGIRFKDIDPETEKELTYEFNVRDAIKLDKAEELVSEAREKNQRVVIFSQFSEPLTLLHERLGPKSVVHDGRTPEFRRQEIQRDFDPKVTPVDHKWDVVLVNYKSGGEGLNLQGASQTILVDREWGPKREEQAIHRVNRMGQVRETTTHIIEVEDTVDSFMAALISEKADLIGGFEDEAKLFRAAYDALVNGEM